MENGIVSVNYFAVFAAALLSMVTGSIWYGPLLGNTWMKELGFKKPAKMTEAIKRQMMQSYSLMFVGSLVMAYVLSHVMTFAASYRGTSGIMTGVTSGFWMWLGFVAPVTLGSVLWEGKSWKMWSINNGYYLITLPLMGWLIGFLG